MLNTRTMGSLILIITILYGSMVLGMVLLQRKLMYHPDVSDVTPAAFGLTHFHDEIIESEDGTKIQLWYHEAQAGKPTIIYFHGNAGNLGNRAPLLGVLAEKGFGVAAVSYRGYGKSEGSPTEKGIYSDARATIKWVKARGIPLSNIVYYGESLGTGVAVKMAIEFPPKWLFLQAPYTSVVNRAAEIYWYVPVKLLLADHFDSLSRIKDVRCPLMIFHGKLDPVIPFHHAETLMAAANEPKSGIFFDEVGHVEFDNELIAQHIQQAISPNLHTAQ